MIDSGGVSCTVSGGFGLGAGSLWSVVRVMAEVWRLTGGAGACLLKD